MSHLLSPSSHTAAGQEEEEEPEEGEEGEGEEYSPFDVMDGMQVRSGRSGKRHSQVCRVCWLHRSFEGVVAFVGDVGGEGYRRCRCAPAALGNGTARYVVFVCCTEVLKGNDLGEKEGGREKGRVGGVETSWTG